MDRDNPNVEHAMTHGWTNDPAYDEWFERHEMSLASDYIEQDNEHLEAYFGWLNDMSQLDRPRADSPNERVYYAEVQSDWKEWVEWEWKRSQEPEEE